MPSQERKYTVHPSPFPLDTPGFHQFQLGAFVGTLVGVPLLAYALLFGAMGGGWWWLLPVLAIVCYPAVHMAFVLIDSLLKNHLFAAETKTPGLGIDAYLAFKDNALKHAFASKARIPMETFFEAYFDKKIDIKGDMLEVLEQRHDWASFAFTWGHVRFIFGHLIPEALGHSRRQDMDQVRDHYDRGNDFYEAFLGPMMVYTSGIITRPNERETLEQLQENKLNLVCEKIQLKSEDKLLDIGCGWGTLLAHAAKKYGTNVTGVTLAREQTEWGLKQAKDKGVKDKVNIMCKDYRDIPRPFDPNGQKYNKITCLEMAEHVGIRKFNKFLLQVYELLEDDGIFYMQIAGLRRPWQYEDLVWGMFMNKYIFPGADASCPLNWVIGQLEYAGFEVQSVDTIGVHYSATIERWYQNWMKPENKAKVIAKYGEKWWRIWELFLAWSSIISRQGSATCYQIVAHKNTNRYQRMRFTEGYHLKRLEA